MAASNRLSIKACYKTTSHRLQVPAESTFGEVKAAAAKQIKISPEYLKILFRGREKPDGDSICAAGVKDGAKVHVVETEEYKRKHGAELEAQGTIPSSSVPPEAVQDEETDPLKSQIMAISVEVDSLEPQVQDLQGMVVANSGGGSVDTKKFKMVMELLTQKLLKLDNMEVTGPARELRRQVINRVNRLCDQLEQINPGQ
eukprot:CAMPEP_0117651990 /NCGR_PEP_ID=MMETSP0804-20121206/2388_1 /TAXON_ID=1074897 /ORGANISM="Tetraselmis astigmatica, Strain CCMP880" /LENGTH=199 /DNA_ID=CAMNT_0005458007 /DNA_START=224 /DNA_END=823 /DNA_ORIENTATION=+